MAKQEKVVCGDSHHDRIKETLDFLLHAYRAKLAVDNPSENCPFDFTEFLRNWKDKYGNWDELRDSMTRDLEPLANEGLFDSILPYLAASLNQSNGKREQARKASASAASPNSTSYNFTNASVISAELVPLTVISPGSPASSAAHATGVIRRDSLSTKKNESSASNGDDPEIIIHVCDEAKSLKKDFFCVQSILVKEMGYFTKVTVKGQRLRDMDISVHCDIAVFEWLMKWVKSRNGGYERTPSLDPVTVIGLMVSADFLQMSNLVSECLEYAADSINLIINQSPNLGCLNESLTNRILHFFSNFEVETRINHIDKSDRITSRLYTQLILALNDPEPDENLGHFASTASLFRCNICDKLLINNVAAKLPCYTVKSDCRGRIFACHVRDPNWTLSQFIRDLKKELKLWKLVYWRLWSLVHFFCCAQCQQYFAAKDYSSCKFHPSPPTASVVVVVKATEPGEDVVTLSTKEEGSMVQQQPGHVSSARRSVHLKKDNDGKDPEGDNIVFPHGIYPCCKQSSFQFSPFPTLSGCEFKDHTLSHYAEDDPALKLITTFKELIVVSSTCAEKVSVDWATLIDLTPQKLPSTSSTTGALSQRATAASMHNEMANRRRMMFKMESSSTESNSLSDNEEFYPKTDETIFLNSRYSSNLSDYWSWNPEYTTRYNQDMQREKEEKLMADLETLLAQRVAIDSSGASGFPTSIRLGYLSRRTQKNNGGSFLKLEEKWREEVQHSGLKAAKHTPKFPKP